MVDGRSVVYVKSGVHVISVVNIGNKMVDVVMSKSTVDVKSMVGVSNPMASVNSLVWLVLKSRIDAVSVVDVESIVDTRSISDG